MEEEKAAAYYDELTRKGEGAARFKQGLGFSSSNDPPKPKAKPSSSIFSNFVRASSPDKAAEIQKEAQLESIQNKLSKRRPCSPNHGDRNFLYPDRSRRQSLGREKSSRRERDRDRSSHRHRSRSRERYGSSRRQRSRSNSRSLSPPSRGHKLEKERGSRRSPQRQHSSSQSKRPTAAIDYTTLIEGFSGMTSAERVRAKMQLQLSQTAAEDKTIKMGIGWERFDFNKEAPLSDDDDDEIEVAEDDASLVKHIGQSFRFTAVQAKQEELIKAAHDQAMFGVPTASQDHPKDEPIEEYEPKERKPENLKNDLVGDKVITMQQGSWRDRARNFKLDQNS